MLIRANTGTCLSKLATTASCFIHTGQYWYLLHSYWPILVPASFILAITDTCFIHTGHYWYLLHSYWPILVPALFIQANTGTCFVHTSQYWYLLCSYTSVLTPALFEQKAPCFLSINMLRIIFHDTLFFHWVYNLTLAKKNNIKYSMNTIKDSVCTRISLIGKKELYVPILFIHHKIYMFQFYLFNTNIFCSNFIYL